MKKTEENKKINAGRVKSMNKFADALFSLMRKKKFDDVTITDLSIEAGLVRKTFYRNFDRIEDVLTYKLDTLFDEISQKFDFSVTGASSIYAFCFEYLLRNRDFAVVFAQPTTERIALNKIKEYIEKAYSETLHGAASFEPALSEYFTSFIADGIVSVIRTWVNNDCKQPPAVMAEMTHRFFAGVVS